MSTYDKDAARGTTAPFTNADPASRIAGWLENVQTTGNAYLGCPSDLSLRSALAALQGLETALRDSDAIRVLERQREAV